ncbi:MAG: deoxyribonuclease IV [Acidobacteriota bacterium]
MPLLGAHLSAAGGPSRAVAAAIRLGCRSLQIFLRPPGRWAAGPLSEEEADRFASLVAQAGLGGAAFAHAPYLLNLASADESLRTRSITALVEELQRAGRLGLAGVVLHPGSAGTGDREAAARRCRTALGEAIRRAGAGAARVLLEGTAGGGGHLGSTPAGLAALVPEGHSVGVCLDTAHLWGAGYDLTGAGWKRVASELEEHFGRPAPDLVHANDTNVPFGSRRDRHAPPGEGLLGEAFYRRLLGEPALAGTPVVVEIPPGEDNRLIAVALERLRGWSGGGRRPRRREDADSPRRGGGGTESSRRESRRRRTRSPV